RIRVMNCSVILDISGSLRCAKVGRRRGHALRRHRSNSKSNVFDFMYLLVATTIRVVVLLRWDLADRTIAACPRHLPALHGTTLRAPRFECESVRLCVRDGGSSGSASSTSPRRLVTSR